MNPILKQRKAFGRRMRNVTDDDERRINKRIYRSSKPYFTKVNVYGRNLEDARRIMINDAIDGLQPAADLIRILTSCKNNILTRPEKRNVNKLTHKVAASEPGELQPATEHNWIANKIPALRREFEATDWIAAKGADVWKHLELPCDNTKLGPDWTYVALETGWECCAFGCQCRKICYARKMEAGPTGKGIVMRVWRQQKQMRDLPASSIAQDMVDFIKTGKRGVRFCDTGGIPDQEMLDKIFLAVDIAAKKLIEEDLNPHGRFYIYATRYDLDWTGLPKYLRVNASNKDLHDMIPSSNYFKIMGQDENGNKIEEEEDEERLFCSCNCEACDYCPEGMGETIDQQGH